MAFADLKLRLAILPFTKKMYLFFFLVLFIIYCVSRPAGSVALLWPVFPLQQQCVGKTWEPRWRLHAAIASRYPVSRLESFDLFFFELVNFLSIEAIHQSELTVMTETHPCSWFGLSIFMHLIGKIFSGQAEWTAMFSKKATGKSTSLTLPSVSYLSGVILWPSIAEFSSPLELRKT